MDKIEFKPALFSLPRVMVMLAVVAVDIILGILVLPRALELSKQYPNDPTASQVLWTTSGVMVLVPLILLFIIIVTARSKKIWIDDGLIYFANKSFFGSWVNTGVNLKDITNIEWKEKRVFMGKAVAVYCWLVFTFKDKHKQEVHISGWDYPTLRTILLYIKGKYSDMKINTPVHRDSSEELSGINEFLGKNESKQ